MLDMTEAQIASLHAADRRARDINIERAAVTALVPTFADPICDGTGRVWANGRVMQTCETCDGSGQSETQVLRLTTLLRERGEEEDLP